MSKVIKPPVRCQCSAFELFIQKLGNLAGYTTEGVTHTEEACGKFVLVKSKDKS
jgi:hypothetical protein